MTTAWEDVLGPELTVTDGSVGRRIVMRGDRLDVSAAAMPSIISRTADARTGVELLAFDARRVVIRDPVALAQGRILVVARTVELAGSARFVVAKPSSAAVDDSSGLPPGFGGVEIHCETLVLTQAPRLVFAFRSALEAERTLRVVCSRVVGEGGAVLDPQEGERLIRSTTLGAWQGPPYEADVRVGDEEAYLATFRTVARWPEAFARTLEAAHALAPFDPDVTAGIRLAADGELAGLAAWRETGPLTSVKGTVALIEAGLDANGRTSEHVPRQELGSLLDHVERSAGLLTTGGLPAALEEQILAGLQERRLDTARLEQVRTSARTAADARASLLERLGESLVQAIAAGAEAQSALERARYEKARVERDLAERIARAEAGAEGMRAIKAVALVGSLVPAVAPVALAVGAAAELAGTLVYRHNGGPGGKDVVTDLAAAVASAQALQAAFAQVRGAWASERRNSELADIAEGGSREKLWRALNPPPQTGEAAEMPEDWKAPTAKSFKDAALNDAVRLLGDLAKVAEGLEPPKPAIIDQSEAEQRDPGYQAALALAVTANARLAEANAAVVTLKGALAASGVEARRWSDAEHDLLDVRPANDEEIARWAAAASRVRRALFRQLWSALPDVDRALSYATGQRLPAELLAPAMSLAFPKDEGGPGADARRAAFDDERRRIMTAVTAIVEAARETYRAHLLANSMADLYVEQSGAIAPNVKGDSVASGFVRLLNEAVAAAIDNPGATPAALPLPMEFTPDEARPRRFLDALVSDVALRDEADLARRFLIFTILHPGFGTLWFDGEPRRFDLRTGGVGDATARVSSWPPGETPLWARDGAATATSVAAKDFRYASLPLEAPYFITVQIQGDEESDEWKRKPVIESLSLSFAVLR